MNVLIFILIISIPAFSAKPIVLVDSLNQYSVAFDHIEILEDASSSITIDDIKSGKYDSKFLPNKVQLPRNKNLKSAYWIKFTVVNDALTDVRWLLEFFDSSIQQIMVFIPDQNGVYTEYASGNNLPFEFKKLQHKNYEFVLPDIRNKPLVIYARFKSSHLIFMYSVIRSYERFANYGLAEYYFLGIFYGIIVAMAIYNFLLFVTVHDKTYLYYVFYVLSSGFLCMVMDGTGFQWVWPSYPEFNNKAFSIALFMMVIWGLMYIQGFVYLKSRTRLHINLLEIVIIIRMLIFILAHTLFPRLKDVVYIDIFILLICYVSGFVSLKSGNVATRYFLIGFTLFFCGFIISNLTVNSIFGFTLPNNIYTVYSFNLGIVLEMILLSYALAERIRVIIREREEAQAQSLLQLEETNLMKEKQKEELELKVVERTFEISKQKEELELKNGELSILYEEIKDNIKVAKWIQESILPPESLIQKYLKENYILYKPKDVVSGDFYWFEYKNDKVYLAAVDCTGHGVAGAFMSIIGYNILNQVVRNPDNARLNAAEILDELNNNVIETLRQKHKDRKSRDGMDINLIIIDLKNYSLDYAGAVNYLYIIRNGELLKLVADSFSIGIPKTGDVQKFTHQNFKLEKGDILIQYTDGYADQLGGPDGYSKFMYPRFREMFLEVSKLPMANQKEIIEKNIEKWRGEQEQTDDILVIGTKIL
ncbi:MAG: 7TM diverse intracellular signaling domain-containing protein [Bacteroidota bacterium]|nr:7TM diverse intracellular signaling domain-containing protein [Bacteroidota bacterium]